MKTSVIEVHDMLSVLSVQGVEEKIGEVPGVESATVNYAAGSVTVRYDETRLELADIKSSVRQSAFASDAPTTASTDDNHENHTAPSVPASRAGAAPKASPAAAAPAGPKTPPVTAAKNAAPADAGQPETSTALTPAAAAPQ